MVEVGIPVRNSLTVIARYLTRGQNHIALASIATEDGFPVRTDRK